MKAMILAAGLGKRLKPFTSTKPKALFEVEEHTLLEWTIRYLKKHGISELIVNVHHFPDQIKDYLKRNNGFGSSFKISDESSELMNTGGAIVKASEYLKDDGPFVVMGTDILTELDLGEMIRFHNKRKPLVTLAVKERKTSRSLLFDSRLQLMGWRDNNNGNMKGTRASAFSYALGFSAIQIIEPEIFNKITETGAFSIIDLYLRLMDSDVILGYRHDSAAWFELGRSERIGEITNNPVFKRIIRTI